MTRRLLLATLVILVVLSVTWLTHWNLRRQRWYDLREQQWAEIERFRKIPPAGWTDNQWQGSVTTAYNVWGNTLNIPESATEAEMSHLLERLGEIVGNANPDNSLTSLEQVFDVLLERDPDSDFIRGYKESACNLSVNDQRTRTGHAAEQRIAVER